MKILTVTCNNAENYGARLQAAALAAWLRSEGHDAHVLDYRPWYMHHYPPRPFHKSSPADIARRILHAGYYRNSRLRYKKFVEFSERHGFLTSSVYKSRRAIDENPPQADAFIAGSDQIWNTSLPNGLDPVFYLDFAPDGCRRISYAASFGHSVVESEHRPWMRMMLATFNNLCVRERSGARAVTDLGLPEPFVGVDPVFLNGAGFWHRMADEGKTPEPGRYILVYDFMRSDVVRGIATRTAALRGARIVAVGARRLPYAHENHLQASPQDFLALVRGAGCVVSNSFHGTAFAMIFGRDFFVVKREDGLNERMHDLLDRYGLTERLVHASTPDSTLAAAVDFNALGPVLAADIENSKNYLRKTLEK